MLRAFGADLTVDGLQVSITNKNTLSPVDVLVPGDISSAAFFIVGAALVKDSKVTFKNVGLNETRTGILDVLHQMGAEIQIINEREESGEVLGDLIVVSKKL